MYPDDLKYAKSHEWARIEDDVVTIGLSSFALDHLQDLVFLELPEEETEVEVGESFGQIESVKAVSDINSPVTGEIIEVNEDLVDDLETMKDSPYEDGWLVKIKVTDPAGLEDLIDVAAYEKHCEAEEED